MKYALVAVAVALGASIVDVSATPLRVLLIDSKPPNIDAPVAVVNNMRFGHAIENQVTASAVPIQVINAMRFGHATPNAAAPTAQPSSIDSGATTAVSGHRHRHGCGRGRSGFARKMVAISNAFRHLFGLPEIQPYHHHHRLHNDSPANSYEIPSEPGEYRILPFIGTPPTFIKVDEQTGEVTTKGGDTVHILPMGVPNRPVMTMNAHEETFIQRLMSALMSLGSFESKVVAFILGCGLGVLLRMIWVLGVVTYRSVRGGNEQEEQEYNLLLVDDIDANAEIIFITDEKAPIEPNVGK